VRIRWKTLMRLMMKSLKKPLKTLSQAMDLEADKHCRMPLLHPKVPKRVALLLLVTPATTAAF
jgi:hypothetical protein